jgi:hypothetical protein
MDRIYDLTDKEVLALTDEQVAKYVDYECALKGAPMLPTPAGIKPVANTPAPDITAFKIAGFYTLDAAQAERILDAINSGIVYESKYQGSDYSCCYLSPITVDSYYFPKIETAQFHSAEQWDRIKDDRASIASKLKEWEELDNAYSDALNKRADISDDIWEYVGAVRAKAREMDTLRNDFKRYLELAEGNKRIAFNFLKKVKDVYRFPELEEEFCGEVEEEKENEI